MSPEKIKELEKKFYLECTYVNDFEDEHTISDWKEVFQWIVDNVIKAKEEERQAMFDDPEELHYENDECKICGLTDDHSLDCPNDNSPFGTLLREGYD